MWSKENTFEDMLTYSTIMRHTMLRTYLSFWQELFEGKNSAACSTGRCDVYLYSLRYIGSVICQTDSKRILWHQIKFEARPFGANIEGPALTWRWLLSRTVMLQIVSRPDIQDSGKLEHERDDLIQSNPSRVVVNPDQVEHLPTGQYVRSFNDLTIRPRKVRTGAIMKYFTYCEARTEVNPSSG